MQVAELTVRVNPVGGDIAPRVTLSPEAWDPSGHSSILLLIHGYNNSFDEANAAYETFLTALDKSAGRPVAMPIYKFFWPGDTHLKFFSALSYPFQISHVQTAADRLGSYLQGLHGPAGTPINIHFVCHSLGNRLLIDLLQAFQSNPQVVIASVTLMAAAVPVSKVSEPGSLYAATRLPLRSQALHSRGDMVLFLAFPAGEMACLDAFWPTAVGRAGEPIANWNSHVAFDKFAHGDYWVKPGPVEQILPMLGYSASRSTNSSALPERVLTSRTIPGNTTPVR
jgi:hypothetical protein